jgi:hypothetical protein
MRKQTGIPERRLTQLNDIHLYNKWKAHNTFAAILYLIATDGTVAPSPSPTASARVADISPPQSADGVLYCVPQSMAHRL